MPRLMAPTHGDAALMILRRYCAGSRAAWAGAPRGRAPGFAANWQRRFKPTRHHVAGAGNHAPPSIWRAINGYREPAARDRSHVRDQYAALFVLLRASQPVAHPRRAGADM